MLAAGGTGRYADADRQAPEAVPVQKATPAGQPLPVAQEQDGDGGEKLRERLEEIDAYDGWKR